MDDVEDIIAMMISHFQTEIDQIFVPNPSKMRYELYSNILKANYANTSFINVAKQDDKIIAWNLFTRGHYTPYSNEEIACAEFIHTDLSLSARIKAKLVAQSLEMAIAWCHLNTIPVLNSTSIRQDQAAFMRLHELYGFIIRGSFAYKKIKE